MIYKDQATRALTSKAVFRQLLMHEDACGAGRIFARNKTLEQAWKTCTDGSLMDWWLFRLGVSSALRGQAFSLAHAITRAQFPKLGDRRLSKRVEIVRAVLLRSRFSPTGDLL